MERAALLPRPFFVALAIGSMLWWPNRKEKGELKSREGFLIVVLFWTVLGKASVRSLYLLGKPEPHDYRCVFESSLA